MHPPLSLPPPLSLRTFKLTSRPDKSTWWGCGSHIPNVLDPLPKDSWCTCEPRRKVDGGEADEYPPMGERAD
ncbi:MAG: hypothetical protein M1817_002071 [Caeruleum heppii]|nr:MAG: hypothetical protein M1817_002071 [Caeruleum heppii]